MPNSSQRVSTWGLCNDRGIEECPQSGGKRREANSEEGWPSVVQMRSSVISSLGKEFPSPAFCSRCQRIDDSINLHHWSFGTKPNLALSLATWGPQCARTGISFHRLRTSARPLVYENTIAMSGQSAPSPVSRSASTGPNGPLTTQVAAPLVNGVTGGSVSGPSGSVPTATGGGASSSMSQQNLNQIVSNPSLILRELRCLGRLVYVQSEYTRIVESLGPDERFTQEYLDAKRYTAKHPASRMRQNLSRP